MSADDVLSWLKQHGTRTNVQALTRYGITAPRAFGVTVGDLKKHAKTLGVDHALAQRLWDSGWYEARMLAIFVDDSRKVTRAQMRRWARDFDNWAIVDTACFSLFDRAPDAWAMLEPWAKAQAEFTKRAAFALIWALSVHDKSAPDSAFRRALQLVERGASDERHFVKKAVDMALRAVGKRNAALREDALRVANRLADAEAPAPRWVGTHARRELASRAGATARSR